MNHPECLHATANSSDDYSGTDCCVCSGRPCEAVTVELMAAHRTFDIDLYSDSGRVCVRPF